MRGQIVHNGQVRADGADSTIQVAFDDIDLAKAAATLPYARRFPDGGIAIVPTAHEQCGGRIYHVDIQYVTCVTWKIQHPLGVLGSERDLSEKLAAAIIAKVLADAALATCALNEQPWR